MNRAVIASCSRRRDRGGRSVACGHRRAAAAGPQRRHGHAGCGGAGRPADLLSGSGRQAVLFADAEEDAGRPRLSRRSRQRRRQLRRCRRGGEAGGIRRPAERKIKYYRNPMGLPDTSPVPKKDSMGMDYIAVYEGEDSDDGSVKLSPGRIQRTGREIRAGGAPRDQVHGQGAGDDPTRRAPRFRRRDEVRKLSS